MPNTLVINDLHVNVEGNPVLKGVNLSIRSGEIHALMGPNGTGKSTFAYTLMGHPKYKITHGKILLNGNDLTAYSTDERARMGLFMAFQYPVAISGVSVANFLRTALNVRRRDHEKDGKGIPIPQFRKLLKEKMKLLQMDHQFAGRYLNDGFSGGEKKRAEILQLAVLEPTFAILDETDSGLDIDALRIVASGVETTAGPDMGVLIITHYQRMLDFIKPHTVHVMFEGRIVETGGADLALRLEREGYEWIRVKYEKRRNR